MDAMLIGDLDKYKALNLDDTMAEIFKNI